MQLIYSQPATTAAGAAIFLRGSIKICRCDMPVINDRIITIITILTRPDLFGYVVGGNEAVPIRTDNSDWNTAHVLKAAPSRTPKRLYLNNSHLTSKLKVAYS